MTRAVTIAELGDTNVFTADGTNNRVGIGSTQPTAKLDVGGDGNVSGTLTATSFSGDGTGLTGVASTDNIITGTAATFTNNVNISGITTVGVLTATQVNVTGVTTGVTATFTGDVSVRNLTGVAATFTGVLTYEDVTNIDSVGLVTARSGLRVVGGGLTVTGVSTFFSDVSIADKIIHTGDTNTAIRFPAADTFTVETSGSEAIRVDSSGRLLLGHTSSVNISGLDSHLQVVGTDTEKSSISVERFANDAAEPFLIFAKSRNASKGGNTVVQDGDTLGRITFQGADGSDYEEAAFIKGEVDGTPADDTTDMPGRLLFATTPNGDHSPIERLRITSSGISLFKSGLAEKVNVKSQLTSANACAITDGNVILTTSAEPGNTYPDITGVHSVLSSGEGFSVTIALKVDGSGTINGFRIDGVAQTIEWSGGSGPSAGSNGYDVFSFSVFKTGSGTTDYTVFGAAANYT